MYVYMLSDRMRKKSCINYTSFSSHEGTRFDWIMMGQRCGYPEHGVFVELVVEPTHLKKMLDKIPSFPRVGMIFFSKPPPIYTYIVVCFITKQTKTWNRETMTPINFQPTLEASPTQSEIPNFKTWRLINWACGNGKAGKVSTTRHSWDVMLTTWCIKFNSLILAADL